MDPGCCAWPKLSLWPRSSGCGAEVVAVAPATALGLLQSRVWGTECATRAAPHGPELLLIALGEALTPPHGLEALPVALCAAPQRSPWPRGACSGTAACVTVSVILPVPPVAGWGPRIPLVGEGWGLPPYPCLPQGPCGAMLCHHPPLPFPFLPSQVPGRGDEVPPCRVVCRSGSLDPPRPKPPLPWMPRGPLLRLPPPRLPRAPAAPCFPQELTERSGDRGSIVPLPPLPQPRRRCQHLAGRGRPTSPMTRPRRWSGMWSGISAPCMGLKPCGLTPCAGSSSGPKSKAASTSWATPSAPSTTSSTSGATCGWTSRRRSPPRSTCP